MEIGKLIFYVEIAKIQRETTYENPPNVHTRL